MSNKHDFPNHAGRYAKGGPHPRHIDRPRLTEGTRPCALLTHTWDGGLHIEYYQYGIDFSEVPSVSSVNAQSELLILLQSIATMQANGQPPHKVAAGRALLDAFEARRGRTKTLELIDWYNRNRGFGNAKLKRIGAKATTDVKDNPRPFKRKINVKVASDDC